MKGVAAVIAPMLLSVSSAVLAGPSPGPGPAPHGSPQATADAWGSIRFLVGDWVGEGSGKPGQGRGSFSFRFDLEQKILVRRSHSEYPAAGEKPAIVHDDLMVCYPDPAGGRILAIYLDNEGHIIHYVAESDGPGRLVLVSEPRASSPGFRLTYTRLEGDTVAINFEIAPPGGTEFVPYLSGKAARAAKP